MSQAPQPEKAATAAAAAAAVAGHPLPSTQPSADSDSSSLSSSFAALLAAAESTASGASTPTDHDLVNVNAALWMYLHHCVRRKELAKEKKTSIRLREENVRLLEELKKKRAFHLEMDQQIIALREQLRALGIDPPQRSACQVNFASAAARQQQARQEERDDRERIAALSCVACGGTLVGQLPCPECRSNCCSEDCFCGHKQHATQCPAIATRPKEVIAPADRLTEDELTVGWSDLCRSFEQLSIDHGVPFKTPPNDSDVNSSSQLLPLLELPKRDLDAPWWIPPAQFPNASDMCTNVINAGLAIVRLFGDFHGVLCEPKAGPRISTLLDRQDRLLHRLIVLIRYWFQHCDRSSFSTTFQDCIDVDREMAGLMPLFDPSTHDHSGESPLPGIGYVSSASTHSPLPIFMPLVYTDRSMHDVGSTMRPFPRDTRMLLTRGGRIIHDTGLLVMNMSVGSLPPDVAAPLDPSVPFGTLIMKYHGSARDVNGHRPYRGTGLVHDAVSRRARAMWSLVSYQLVLTTAGLCFDQEFLVMLDSQPGDATDDMLERKVHECLEVAHRLRVGLGDDFPEPGCSKFIPLPTHPLETAAADAHLLEEISSEIFGPCEIRQRQVAKLLQVLRADFEPNVIAERLANISAAAPSGSGSALAVPEWIRECIKSGRSVITAAREKYRHTLAIVLSALNSTSPYSLRVEELLPLSIARVFQIALRPEDRDVSRCEALATKAAELIQAHAAATATSVSTSSPPPTSSSPNATSATPVAQSPAGTLFALRPKQRFGEASVSKEAALRLFLRKWQCLYVPIHDAINRSDAYVRQSPQEFAPGEGDCMTLLAWVINCLNRDHGFTIEWPDNLQYGIRRMPWVLHEIYGWEVVEVPLATFGTNATPALPGDLFFLNHGVAGTVTHVGMVLDPIADKHFHCSFGRDGATVESFAALMSSPKDKSNPYRPCGRDMLELPRTPWEPAPILPSLSVDFILNGVEDMLARIRNPRVPAGPECTCLHQRAYIAVLSWRFSQ